MSRYIDSDKLAENIESLKRHSHVNYEELEPMHAVIAETIDKAIDKTLDVVLNLVIKKIPTADVQEVRHGEWEVHPTGDIDWEMCGNCKMGVRTGNFIYSYCPYCGAKMDKE